MIKNLEDIKKEWLATIDALVDPLLYVGEDYTVFKGNRSLAKISTSDIKQLEGQKCYKLLADRDSPCPGCLMSEAFHKQEVRHFELRNIRNKYFYEATSQPLFDENAKISGMVQIYRDRSDTKFFQEKLIQSEKLASIGLLAGGIAHEINNPLTGIIAFSQMLLKELPKTSPFYSDVVEIEEAAQRCKAISARLLEFSRGQTPRKRKIEAIDITLAAKSALKFSQFHPDARKIKVIEKWQSVPPLVLGEKNLVVQLFLNLIQNAYQAMPKGGTLVLRSFQQELEGKPWGVWELQDSGQGIDNKELEKIFEPFYTTKEEQEGTGLGLAISSSICKDLGGRIEVESQLGTGTLFRVLLPLKT